MSRKSFTVVDPKDMKDDDIAVYVCGNVNHGNYDDNVHGECADCRTPIIWRPHAPERAAKICRACADKRMKQYQAEGHTITPAVTPGTAEDIARYLETKK